MLVKFFVFHLFSPKCVSRRILTQPTINPDGPELTAGTGDKIIERLEQRQITHADLLPALLDVLPEPSQTSSLETIIVGGQATKPDTISRWSDLVRLVNVYGPTEATVCTSLGICSSKNLLPSIGQPIDNVEYLVVDRDMNPIVPGLSLIHI